MLLTSNSVTAAQLKQNPSEAITVIGPHLAGRLDDDPTSGYNLLLKEILPSETHFFKYRRYPIARAIRNFGKIHKACAFPTSTHGLAETPAHELIQSRAVDYVTAHLVTSKKQQTVQSLDQLNGLKLVIQTGLNVEFYVGEGGNYEVVRAPDDVTALRMLLAGRVDVMYAWFPDIYIIAEKNHLPKPHFDADFVLFQTTTHLVCKKFDGAEALFEIVNSRIQHLRTHNKLRKILGPHARIVGIDIPDPIGRH